VARTGKTKKGKGEGTRERRKKKKRHRKKKKRGKKIKGVNRSWEKNWGKRRGGGWKWTKLEMGKCSKKKRFA